MHATVRKRKPCGTCEGTREVGDDDLRTGGLRHDAVGFVNSDAANVRTDALDLADMDADAQLQAVALSNAAHRLRARKRKCGPVEGRKKAVAGGLYLVAVMAIELCTDALKVRRQE